MENVRKKKEGKKKKEDVACRCRARRKGSEGIVGVLTNSLKRKSNII